MAIGISAWRLRVVPVRPVVRGQGVAPALPRTPECPTGTCTITAMGFTPMPRMTTLVIEPRAFTNRS